MATPSQRLQVVQELVYCLFFTLPMFFEAHHRLMSLNSRNSSTGRSVSTVSRKLFNSIPLILFSRHQAIQRFRALPFKLLLVGGMHSCPSIKSSSSKLSFMTSFHVLYNREIHPYVGFILSRFLRSFVLYNLVRKSPRICLEVQTLVLLLSYSDKIPSDCDG